MKVKSAIYKTGLTLGVMVLGLVAMVQGVSGLGYQKSVGVQFTFEPMLAISLSSADLIIPNLAPGSSDYSNTITVRVDTNSIGGYTLSAKVGNGTSYTNDKLTNSSGAVFNNLSSNSNLTLAQFSDSDWGYALGTVSDSSTYSGLIYDTDTVINATTNSAGTAASSGCVSTCSGTNNTKFTIAAKASATQVSGDYKNVIIFTVVGNPAPLMTISDLTYLQDFETLSSTDRTSVLASMTQGTSYNLLDKRDDKSYRIAKLADGNVWLQDNLALDLVNVSLVDLEGNTNASNVTLEYLKGVRTRDASLYPNSGFPTTAVSHISQYTNTGYSVPSIAASGSCSGADCANSSLEWSSTSSIGEVIQGKKVTGKVGIYYNYCAASAGSYCYGNGNSYTGSPSSDPDPNTYQDVKEDICPSGWRLPVDSGFGSLDYLKNQYNSTDAFRSALKAVYTGYFNGRDADLQKAALFYHTSTFTNSFNMEFFVIDTTPLNVYQSRRTDYFTIRCVLNF